MSDHLTHRSRPDLDWRPRPKGQYICDEMLKSDAWRSLSKTESDLLLFVLSRRIYPSAKQKNKKSNGRMDYWQPINAHDIKIPYAAIHDFFNAPGMQAQAPSDSTITRSIKKLMAVGFISLEQIGGNGKGDMSRYRLAHNWRTWKRGDPPCFEKAGMTREKGFCKPGAKTFCPSKN